MWEVVIVIPILSYHFISAYFMHATQHDDTLYETISYLNFFIIIIIIIMIIIIIIDFIYYYYYYCYYYYYYCIIIIIIIIIVIIIIIKNTTTVFPAPKNLTQGDGTRG